MQTTLHPTDLLQVTAQACGTVLLTITMSGANTLGDVFRQVRESASTASTPGIVNVSLRNRTQGWTCHHNLVIRPSTNTPTGSRNLPSYPSLFASA